MLQELGYTLRKLGFGLNCMQAIDQLATRGEFIFFYTDLWSSDGRIIDSSTNSSDGITAARIEVVIIRDLDAIACIESAKSDITYNDSVTT